MTLAGGIIILMVIILCLGSFKPNEEGVSMLQAMGFTRSQCIKALQNTDNNVERAADWIFSHPDEINSEDVASSPAIVVEESHINDGPPGTLFFEHLLNYY